MLKPKIRVPKKKLEQFCKQNHIVRLALFGSVLNDSFGPESDIDVLVEFEPDHVPGFAMIRMQSELSLILDGRKVDLVTPKFLNRRIRDQVVTDALVQYDQKGLDLPWPYVGYGSKRVGNLSRKDSTP
jgi:predicted nucleotidyltransferase